MERGARGAHGRNNILEDRLIWYKRHETNCSGLCYNKTEYDKEGAVMHNDDKQQVIGPVQRST